ncbi:MAG: hypothetical protein KIT02_10195 [Devosia sp.]|uniref:hypothetical protein n=1 Tax=Devosia sp. TaxID=1871048 RepID=UPI0024C8FBB0|nr:hypothetical protein [Devosia sp.]UYN98336.1 MAG: hypothetical protein KIT02_10195 [Devosia sp.]
MTFQDTTATASHAIRSSSFGRFAGYIAAGGLAVLLGGGSTSGATGSMLSNPQPRVHMFVGSGKREAQQSEAILAPSSDIADHVVTELGRLQDGWIEGAIAPSAAIQADVARVLSAFALHQDHLPEVEVDEDGRVALRWLLDRESLFSLEFSGRGEVICSFVHDNPSRCVAKIIPVIDDTAVHRFVVDAGVAERLFYLA